MFKKYNNIGQGGAIMEYNNRIKTVCKENNVTLKWLGENIGKSKQYMSELAKGNIRLTYTMAVEIASAFDTTPDNIFLSTMSNNIGHKKTA